MNLFIILYLVSFIRTIIIIAAIYFGIKLFTRFILPMLIDKGVRNMQQKMDEQQMHSQRSSKHDGEVTIESNRKNNGRNVNEGEYVDFEEID